MVLLPSYAEVYILYHVKHHKFTIILCLQELGNLSAFRSVDHAIVTTLLQLAGMLDFKDTFNKGDLLYTPIVYILFIAFLITTPVLITNIVVSYCHV